nr:hypothetical protein [uncultured Psychroserpens sp.]
MKKLKLLAILIIGFITINCEQEVQQVTPSNDTISGNIEAISHEDAISFLDNKLNPNANFRTLNYVDPIYNLISYEDIDNESEQISVIPAINNANPDYYTRILLLEIDGQIEAIVYSMLFDDNSTLESFSGEILITDLYGNFLNGYVAEDGVITFQYVLTATLDRLDSSSINYNFRGNGCDDCPYEDCNYCGSLDLVVITAENESLSDPVDLSTLDDLAWSALSNSWIIPTSLSNVLGAAVNSLAFSAEAYNPLVAADCRSFEYAMPPGATKRGCAVTDMYLDFYTAGFRSNGSPYYGHKEIVAPLLYYTMPSWMTNSAAANATAAAVSAAILATDAYYYTNPDATTSQVQIFFENALSTEMSLIGGSVSTNPPFSIPSPAPYITSLGGPSIDC